MVCYNFSKFVAADKLQKEIIVAGLAGIAYIATEGAQTSVFFNDELSSPDLIILSGCITAHNVLNQEETIRTIIRNARGFGNQLIEDFATQNIMMGITQDGMTGTVRRACRDVIDCLVTGSLYDAITCIKAIPVENRDPKYLTVARLTIFCNRIETYLGITLTSVV